MAWINLVGVAQNVGAVGVWLLRAGFVDHTDAVYVRLRSMISLFERIVLRRGG